MWRHACPHPDVRGGCRNPVAGQEGFGIEGLGAGYCKAVRNWQGARCIGKEAWRDPAQHLAFRRTVPLVCVVSERLILACRDTSARLRQRG
jgi:hypothetical protein